MNDRQAGYLQETTEGYEFIYDSAYLQSDKPEPISVTMPLTDKPTRSAILFPFFDGLIPEGWLLNIITENWKINPRDRMSLLLIACRDCIGNISIVEDTK